MKTVDARTDKNQNGAHFYITVDGDVCDTYEDAELTGCAGVVKMDDFYPGSFDDWREVAKEIYFNKI